MRKKFFIAALAALVGAFFAGAIPARAVTLNQEKPALNIFFSQEQYGSGEPVAVTVLAAGPKGTPPDSVTIVIGGETQTCEGEYVCQKSFGPFAKDKVSFISYQASVKKDGLETTDKGQVEVGPKDELFHLELSAGSKPEVYVGDKAVITAIANKKAESIFIYSVNILNGELSFLKTCKKTSVCSVTKGPFSNFPIGVAKFAAKATVAYPGAILPFYKTYESSVFSLSIVPPPPIKVEIAAAKEEIRSNEPIKLTVKTDQKAAKIEILASDPLPLGGKEFLVVKTCLSASSCEYTAKNLYFFEGKEYKYFAKAYRPVYGLPVPAFADFASEVKQLKVLPALYVQVSADKEQIESGSDSVVFKAHAEGSIVPDKMEIWAPKPNKPGVTAVVKTCYKTADCSYAYSPYAVSGVEEIKYFAKAFLNYKIVWSNAVKTYVSETKSVKLVPPIAVQVSAAKPEAQAGEKLNFFASLTNADQADSITILINVSVTNPNYYITLKTCYNTGECAYEGGPFPDFTGKTVKYYAEAVINGKVYKSFPGALKVVPAANFTLSAVADKSEVEEGGQVSLTADTQSQAVDQIIISVSKDPGSPDNLLPKKMCYSAAKCAHILSGDFLNQFAGYSIKYRATAVYGGKQYVSEIKSIKVKAKTSLPNFNMNQFDSVSPNSVLDNSDTVVINDAVKQAVEPTINVSASLSKPTANDKITFTVSVNPGSKTLDHIEILVNAVQAASCANRSQSCSYVGGPYAQGGSVSYAGTAYFTDGAVKTTGYLALPIAPAPLSRDQTMGGR